MLLFSFCLVGLCPHQVLTIGYWRDRAPPGRNNMKHASRVLAILLVGLVGCDKPTNRDDTPSPRIVTFSPALTTIMFDMHLGDYVVGVSAYSSLPPGVERPVVGDARDVRTEPILAVRPDLILTQSESKYFDTVKKICPSLKIEHFNLATLAEVASAMERIGRLVGKPELGDAAGKTFRNRLDAVKEKTRSLPKRRVLFVMDYQHPFAAGGDTFLDEMIQRAGGVNVLADTRDWFKPSIETILAKKPDVILCQCKPAQASEAKRYWEKLLAQAHPSVRVYIVTDDTWTIAAGHLATHTEELAEMIHVGK